jgi:hypothetical protein
MKSKIEDYDDDDEAHEKLVAPADWNGPIEDGRHCTDVFCLFLLVLSWVAMSGVGGYAILNGDYRLILYPLDYQGNVCGTDYGNDMTDYPYLWYVNSYTGGVCVNECPSLDGKVSDNLTDVRTLITYSGIWQTPEGGAELPSDFLQVGDYSSASDAQECTLDTCYPNNSTQDSWTSQGVAKGFGFAYYVGDSYELFWRCYLTVAAEEQIANYTGGDPAVLPGYYDSANDFWTNLYGDIWVASPYILGFGFGCSFLLSLIYIFILRLPVLLNALVWLSIFTTIGMFVAAGYYSYSQAEVWADAVPQTVRDETIQYTTIAAYVLWGIAALLVLITCCLRKAIQLAIGCVKEAGKAVNGMILILAMPVLQAIGFIVFWIVWAFYAVNVASLGTITTQNYTVDFEGSKAVSYRVFEFDDFVTNCAWYLLFCLFWTAGFIVAVGDMAVAVAVSKWYFNVDKSQVNSGTVIGSLTATLFYHMGTCAYGSLIIAIIKMIRVVIAKIQRQVAKLDSKVANCLLCCCQCCFCCLEKCLKFINKNAYIQCAIFGTAFCESARKAFFLILRNAARIGAVSYVSAAVLVVGKIFISSMTTGLAYFVMLETIEKDLYSTGGPLVLIFFISYVVSDMFMDVFEIAIMAILHCFVADEEMFDGRPRYAEGALTAWVDKNAGDRD